MRMPSGPERRKTLTIAMETFLMRRVSQLTKKLFVKLRGSGSFSPDVRYIRGINTAPGRRTRSGRENLCLQPR